MFLSSSLFRNMFRPNWPSSGVQGVFKESALLSFVVLDASTCFIQVMLCHAFLSNHMFGIFVICTRLY
jgi:hypothetical protein